MDEHFYNDEPGDKILSEYRHKLAGFRDFEIFWMQLYDCGKVIRVTPINDPDIVGKLDDMKLQEEDRVFLFTCLATSDKLLISEDGDFGISKGVDEYKHRYDWFAEHLGITIMNSDSFLLNVLNISEA